jgi:dephospho-CoA kinase
MLTAGLTGGMACGKSFVARTFRELGAHIIEADELGHEAMMPAGEAWAPIVEAFGKEILDSDGRIGRAALAARVFGNPAELERLNAIVHPAVRGRAVRRMQEIRGADPHAVVIYVAAILLESGAYKDVHTIVVVTCSREQQIERAMEREGATLTDVLTRLSRQMSLEQKKTFADYLIDTSGTKESTIRQTRVVWENLSELA